MKNSLSIEAAQTELLNRSQTSSPAWVPLLNALGGVLSEDIIAKRHVPPFDRAAMDGYALKSLDISTACISQPVILTLTETTEGSSANLSSAPLLCAGIATGDPIPGWADAVIQHEETKKFGDKVHISLPLPPGHNIVRRGEDIKPGTIIACRGTRINASLAAIFAGLGMNTAPVYRPVTIALLSTGNEIVDPADELPPGKVFNSNIYGLAARCRELGAEVINLGIAPDNTDQVAEHIAAGLASADLIVTTGGVSVDKSDVVLPALKRLGADLLFQGIEMKPGSPTLGGIQEGKLIIGLSGNPAAARVAFELIVVPLIKQAMGLNSVLPIRFNGFMAEGFGKSSPQRRLLRGRMDKRNGSNLVRLTGDQSNAALTSFIGCNALIDIPAGSGPVNPGQAIAGFLIDEI